MIDLATERLMTLEAAAKKLLVSKAAIYGWIKQGSKGIHLEAAKLGGCWRTSEEALQRFSDRLTPDHDAEREPSAAHLAKVQEILGRTLVSGLRGHEEQGAEPPNEQTVPDADVTQPPS